MNGHETVKTNLVEHLSDYLPDWVDTVAVDDWPTAPGMIAATDILPIDEDKPWPVVMVSTTAMTQGRNPGPLGERIFVGNYDVKITVGVRTPKNRDPDDAAIGRDRLLQAVRWLLRDRPSLGDGASVLRGFTETTDPVGIDTKGRLVALGTLNLVVRLTETAPVAPDSTDVTVDDTSIEIEASDATDDQSVTITVS